MVSDLNHVVPATSVTQSNNLAPQIIVQQDNSAFPTGIVLDETNYPLRSQLMEMRVGARNKVGYLTSELTKPSPTDPTYGTWITENHKVRSWLIDSMSPHLMQRFIRLAASQEIWEEIKHRTASQKRLVEGIVQLHSMVARLQVHIFLSGLDLEFDQVRGEILRKDPKLDLESCYAYVRREAQQRQIMGSSRPVPESSAMVVQRDTQKSQNISSSGKTNNFNLTGRATIAIQGEQSQHMANVAQPGNFRKVDVFSVTSKENTWIIYTGASDHMTRDSNKLQTIHPSSQQVISTANGNTCNITGEGSVKLSSTLTLETILMDILTRKTLGYDVKRGKLYYLELAENAEHNFGQACHTSGVEKAKEKI
ncbi:hypothetical protein KY284_037581 [Solanum tuberosum]|nr:hypothetical protein KY284_037581 [Solanum tuberosum]